MALSEKGIQDERGLRRHLSITSSPSENDLSFATKLSKSAFKRTLRELSTGETIKIEKPMGRFVLEDEMRDRLIFIAGGIGITPFRSIIRYNLDAQAGHAITLVYSWLYSFLWFGFNQLANWSKSRKSIAVLIGLLYSSTI